VSFLNGTYNTQPDVCLQVRQLMALSFLPVAIIRLTFNNLEAQADPVLIPLFQYFRNQWLTGVPTVLWNVNNEAIRTNNHCEAWHMCFNSAIGRHHPHIWRFLSCLLYEQASVEILHQQAIAGRWVNKKYVVIQKRLNTIRERYDREDMSAVNYITAVSHNLAERH